MSDSECGRQSCVGPLSVAVWTQWTVCVYIAPHAADLLGSSHQSQTLVLWGPLDTPTFHQINYLLTHFLVHCVGVCIVCYWALVWVTWNILHMLLVISCFVWCILVLECLYVPLSTHPSSRSHCSKDILLKIGFYEFVSGYTVCRTMCCMLHAVCLCMCSMQMYLFHVCRSACVCVSHAPMALLSKCSP